MEINSFAGYFPLITDVVLVFFEPSSPHNSQRIDGNQQHNEDNTYYHIKPHAHTTKHKQTQTETQTKNKNRHTDTSPIANTGRPTSFQVARGLHSFWIRTSSVKQGVSQSTGTLTLWQVRAVCAQREPDWTSDHCHCC